MAPPAREYWVQYSYNDLSTETGQIHSAQSFGYRYAVDNIIRPGLQPNQPAGLLLRASGHKEGGSIPFDGHLLSRERSDTLFNTFGWLREIIRNPLWNVPLNMWVETGNLSHSYLLSLPERTYFNRIVESALIFKNVGFEGLVIPDAGGNQPVSGRVYRAVKLLESLGYTVALGRWPDDGETQWYNYRVVETESTYNNHLTQEGAPIENLGVVLADFVDPIEPGTAADNRFSAIDPTDGILLSLSDWTDSFGALVPNQWEDNIDTGFSTVLVSLGGTVLDLPALTTEQLIREIISDEAVETTTDDLITNTSAIQNAITYASEEVYLRLYATFTEASLAESNYIKRNTAYLAIYELFSRRANNVPDTIAMHVQRFLDILEGILANNPPGLEIPGAIRREELGITVQNFEHNPSYLDRPIRLKSDTSMDKNYPNATGGSSRFTRGYRIG